MFNYSDFWLNDFEKSLIQIIEIQITVSVFKCNNIYKKACREDDEFSKYEDVILWKRMEENLY